MNHSLQNQYIQAETVFSSDQYISIEKLSPEALNQTHANAFFTILFTLKGQCHLELQQHVPHYYEKVTNIPEHTFCIIPPEIMHSVSFRDDTQILQILVRKEIFHHHFSDLISANEDVLSYFSRILFQENFSDVLLISVQYSQQMRIVIENMIYEQAHASSYCQNVLYYTMGVLFSLIERHRIGNIRLAGLSELKPLRYPMIYSYICDHYDTVSAREIAEHFHISQSYLCKIFQESAGQTVTQTIQQVRLSQACSLLSQTKIPIHTIAEHVGYNDETFFIRLFKKTYHQTPLQYRNTQSFINNF
ncbi:MAG: helix-turn-helix transcriptional regulator [Eubacteriales bacterium]|nr:helix-turn-helix transcriptional regulator [Eubacteriales bacterium]